MLCLCVLLRESGLLQYVIITFLKVGFYLKALFPSRNLGLMRISRSRFKQSKTVHLCFAEFCKFLGDFSGYLGGDSFSQWISEI